MAWVIVKDGAVVREFSRPTAFTYEGLSISIKLDTERY